MRQNTRTNAISNLFLILHLFRMSASTQNFIQQLSEPCWFLRYSQAPQKVLISVGFESWRYDNIFFFLVAFPSFSFFYLFHFRLDNYFPLIIPILPAWKSRLSPPTKASTTSHMQSPHECQQGEVLPCCLAMQKMIMNICIAQTWTTKSLVLTKSECLNMLNFSFFNK